MWIFSTSEDIWAGSLDFSECIYDHKDAIVKHMKVRVVLLPDPGFASHAKTSHRKK
jgi:hypothetical protein